MPADALPVAAPTAEDAPIVRPVVRAGRPGDRPPYALPRLAHRSRAILAASHPGDALRGRAQAGTHRASAPAAL